jgi:hypothetical protein
MSEELLREVLTQLRELDNKVSAMATEYALREERYDVLATSFKERTKHIEELMSVMNQGKTAAKLVAALIAFVAGIGATWDWLVAHIRIM